MHYNNWASRQSWLDLLINLRIEVPGKEFHRYLLTNYLNLVGSVLRISSLNCWNSDNAIKRRLPLTVKSSAGHSKCRREDNIHSIGSPNSILVDSFQRTMSGFVGRFAWTKCQWILRCKVVYPSFIRLIVLFISFLPQHTIQSGDLKRMFGFWPGTKGIFLVRMMMTRGMLRMGYFVYRIPGITHLEAPQ